MKIRIKEYGGVLTDLIPVLETSCGGRELTIEWCGLRVMFVFNRFKIPWDLM